MHCLVPKPKGLLLSCSREKQTTVQSVQEVLEVGRAYGGVKSQGVPTIVQWKPHAESSQVSKPCQRHADS